MIQVITPNKEYKTKSRGNEMTLIRQDNGGWSVITSNASSRAWNRGMPSIKDFDSLQEVEAAYKSWKGITALVDAETNNKH